MTVTHQHDTGWLPIETAPRDGRELLLFVPAARVKVSGGYWDEHPKCRCWIAGGYMRKTCPPTHWRPLPEPPDSRDEEESK